MFLTVLGCSGSEAPGHRTCSFLLGERALLEMGSAASLLDVDAQTAVDDIFLSHAHLDHVKDLAFFAENIFGRRSNPVHVHATPETLAALQAHVLNDVVWPDFTKLPSRENPVLRYVPFENGRRREIPGCTVSWVPVDHPGTCAALLFDSGEGVLAFSGDTGPTDGFWAAINNRGADVRGIVVETSFPDRLEELAHVSGHLTPALLQGELTKLDRDDVPVYITHIKAPTREETLAELEALGDPRIRVLQAGMEIAF